MRDSINLTAALINPAGTVTGDLDATGCNIGVYYSAGHGKVVQANVHGANYFGIVNNGADVDILDSTISDIGEKPFNGSQHGIGIYFDGTASGDIKRNFMWDYQKNGMVINHSAANADIQQNYMIGFGPVNFIAQNGIEVARGARAKVRQNFVSGHSYTGPNGASSGGILILGGGCFGSDSDLVTNIDVEQNVAVNNDVGIWFFNADAGCASPPSTPTKNTIRNNTLVNNAINNTTGNNPTQGYQAGISDTGNGDVIKNNDVCGLGYTPPGTATAALFDIDVTFTNNPTVKDNTTCAKPRRSHDDDFGHREGHPRPHQHD